MSTYLLLLFNVLVFGAFAAFYIIRQMALLLLTLAFYGTLAAGALLALKHNKLLWPAFLSLPRDLQ